MNYVKKPVIVSAWRNYTGDPVIDGAPGLASPTPEWLAVAADAKTVMPSAYSAGALDIATLEGVVRCNVGDWIIQGIKGELYPCRDDIFQATYEPVV
jgi:hypothetical protein